MNTIEESPIITLEDALNMPEYEHFHEVIRYMQARPNEPLFPKQYEAALKNVVSRDIDALFKENPVLPLRSAVTTILSGLSDEISSKTLLKITQFIIKEWEKLSLSAHKKNRVVQLV
jgi:hypothetical protein